MEKVRLLVIPAARFAANCVLVLGDEPRMNHQPVQATPAEPAEWRNLWTMLALWYGRPCRETFPAFVTPTARKIQAVDRMKTLIAG
jgi:hypothetical protein